MATKKVNVSINPETMKALTEMRLRISQDLGFTPSYSQVIQHLIGKSRHGVGDSANQVGDANE